MFNSGWKSFFKNQAQKRNGIYHSGFLFVNPSLELTVNQTKVLISVDNKESCPKMNFECFLTLRKECEIYIGPQKYGMISISLGPNVQDVLIGDEDFDKSFIIQCHGGDVKGLLTSDIKEKLLSIFEYLPTVLITKTKLILSTKKLIDNERQFAKFIDVGIEVLYEARKLG